METTKHILGLLMGSLSLLSAYCQNANIDSSDIKTQYVINIFPVRSSPEKLSRGWLVDAEDMILLKVFSMEKESIQLWANASGLFEPTPLAMPYTLSRNDTTYYWLRLSDICGYGKVGQHSKNVSTFFISFHNGTDAVDDFDTVIALKTREPVTVRF